jgi:hypothetical protein
MNQKISPRTSKFFVGNLINGWKIIEISQKKGNNTQLLCEKDNHKKLMWTSSHDLKTKEKKLRNFLLRKDVLHKISRFSKNLNITTPNFPNVHDFDFYNWFSEVRKIKTEENILKVIATAEKLLENLNSGSKILTNERDLQNKIINCIDDGKSKKSVNEIILEILDSNNDSSKMFFAKEFTKQNPEYYQRHYIDKKFGIKILAGKKDNSITAHGPKSIRFDKEGNLVFGKNAKNNLKSFDGEIQEPVSAYTFQKITWDKGGNQDSVFEECLNCIEMAKKCIDEGKNQGKTFIFILDGPYYQEKENNKEEYNRIESLKLRCEGYDQILVCTSNTIAFDISKLD